jgi:hypothetical protein
VCPTSGRRCPKPTRADSASRPRAGLLPEETGFLALAAFYATVIQGMSTQACDGACHEDLERVVALKAWPG